jgi:hypothetical protein
MNDDLDAIRRVLAADVESNRRLGLLRGDRLGFFWPDRRAASRAWISYSRPPGRFAVTDLFFA